MAAVKHGGCYFCGTKREEILKSVLKTIIYRNGDQSSGPCALCSVCIKAPVIDLRVTPPQAA